MENRTSLLLKVSIGFFLGILFGFIIAPILNDSYILTDYIMPFVDLIGKIFLTLLTMLTVPLVVSLIISGVASIGNVKTLGRIGVKTLPLFLITTEIAIMFGLIFGNLFQPGSKIDIPINTQTTINPPQSISDFILDIFPNNPIASMANNNMLQIIIFALFVGIACTLIGNFGKMVARFFEDFAKVTYSLTYMVMSFAPYGVFALISVTAARYGLTILRPFAKVIAAVYVGSFIHVIVIYSLLIIFFCKRSPKWFFKRIQGAAITAFVTRSSAATLPITIANVRDKLGVSEKISSFVLPLGATLNMDGTALYQTVCVLFIARAFNVPLTLTMQLELFVFATVASIGTAGITGAGLIMLSVVLTGVGLPIEGVALVAGIDVILGSARTCVNVIGDAAVCAVVASSERETLTV